MDETELISTLQQKLDNTLSVPTRTKGFEDERPVPAVIIDDWDTQDMNFHNSAFSGEVSGDFDDNGIVEYEKYLTFDFKTRVEVLVRHNDEVKASELKEEVKHVLRLIRQFPQQFDSAIKQCRIGSGGSPRTKFTEQNEHELVTTARFHGDHTLTVVPKGEDASADDTIESTHDVLGQVTDAFTFNP